MKQLLIENVRCFRGRIEAPLAPLTLLVGENSTGKSSFLALYRMAWDTVFGTAPVEFNEEPFSLGAYEEIANDRGGTTGRAKSFSVGFRLPLATVDGRSIRRDIGNQVEAIGTYESRDGQPTLTTWSVTAGGISLYARETETGLHTLEMETSNGSLTVTPKGYFVGVGHPRFMMEYWEWLAHLLHRSSQPEDLEDFGLEFPIQQTGNAPTREELALVGTILGSVMQAGHSRPYALAPIRTKPRRTYDPIKHAPRPEGDHAPMVLARASASDSSDWQKFRKSVKHFGTACGLFRDLEVRRLGEKGTDPFQLKVKIAGPPRNLIDVGYGISQALPIFVDTILSAERVFLLQQPEVHLHPRAQAEMGTFIGTLVKEGNRSFVVETHSDYLVDRIRMDIRDGRHLSSDDVRILYFERKNGEPRIHTLTLDDAGNIYGAPPTYRQFFLKEDRRQLVD